MEDNNAIQQQSDVVNFEEKCKQLENENVELKKAINEIYQRARQLENTWLINRAGFLFEVIKSNAFDGDTKIKATDELKAFLFPEEKVETAEVVEENN